MGRLHKDVPFEGIITPIVNPVISRTQDTSNEPTDPTTPSLMDPGIPPTATPPTPATIAQP